MRRTARPLLVELTWFWGLTASLQAVLTPDLGSADFPELLWWTFLLTIYSAVCAYSLRNRLPELSPWIMSVLMSIVVFFCVLMLFSANPFAVVAAGTAPDGEGLNPLLQNYWMMIHPPMLYLVMTGWSVPFAFVLAALITGRLGDEWIKSARRFTLWAWIMHHPRLYEWAIALAALAQKPFVKQGWLSRLPAPFAGWTQSRDFKAVASRSFRQRWQETLQHERPMAHGATVEETTSHE